MAEFTPVTLSSLTGNSAPVTPGLKDRGDFEQPAEEGEVPRLMFQLISELVRLKLLIWNVGVVALAQGASDVFYVFVQNGGGEKGTGILYFAYFY